MGKNSITKEEITALQSIQAKCYQQAFDSGWHNDPTLKTKLELLKAHGVDEHTAKLIVTLPEFQHHREFGTRLALAHSELSEALEGVRKNLMDSHLPDRKCGEVEFADCIIRLLDTATVEGWDIASALAEKHDYNGVRKDHKLETRALADGKKF